MDISPTNRRFVSITIGGVQTLFLRFVGYYRELHVFPDARPDGWHAQLWERDMAEAFLQPDVRDSLIYKELEVAPNGYWIDCGGPRRTPVLRGRKPHNET